MKDFLENCGVILVLCFIIGIGLTVGTGIGFYALGFISRFL